MKSGANPQGKGLVPVVDAWRQSQPSGIEPKSPEGILANYFTALLVLSAEFQFKPGLGVSYYLYRARSQWQLSLISPDEWGARLPGPCLGRCELNRDMTWALHVTHDIESEPALVGALEQFYEGFLHLLDRPTRLEDDLPFYAAQLPYYRRILAAGLASSLAQSLKISGLTGKTGRHWLASFAGNRPEYLPRK